MCQTAAGIHTLPRHPSSKVKALSLSPLMESEAVFQTTFSLLIKISNCNRSCCSNVYTWFLLKKGWAEFSLPQAVKIDFPFPYLLTAHRSGAGCVTLALHHNIRDHLTGDFHNTSAESSWLQQIKTEQILPRELLCKPSHGSFAVEREPVQGF